MYLPGECRRAVLLADRPIGIIRRVLIGEARLQGAACGKSRSVQHLGFICLGPRTPRKPKRINSQTSEGNPHAHA